MAAEVDLTVEQILDMLEAAPLRIAEIAAPLTPEQLRRPPAVDEWSINDVLAHLRSCCDVWGGCIASMLAEENPTLRAVDPRTWMVSTEYPNLEFRPSFEAYAAQRKELLVVLRALPPDAWQRTATMVGSGAPIVRTVYSFGRRLVRHERPHIKQIAAAAKAVSVQA